MYPLQNLESVYGYHAFLVKIFVCFDELGSKNFIITCLWLNKWLSMISDFSSPTLKYSSKQWCSFLSKNFLLLLLDLFSCNYHQFIILFFEQRPFYRSGRSFEQWQHLCSIWWGTLGVSSKEIPYSTSCHWNDLLNVSFLLQRDNNKQWQPFSQVDCLLSLIFEWTKLVAVLLLICLLLLLIILMSFSGFVTLVNVTAIFHEFDRFILFNICIP